MRRLQANLTYMFALADRKNKTPGPSPAYLTAPPLNMQLKLKLPPSTPDDAIERPADPAADRSERDQVLKSLYKKLQSLYPGVDPKKEPAVPPVGGGVRPPNLGPTTGGPQAGGGGPNFGGTAGTPGAAGGKPPVPPGPGAGAGAASRNGQGSSQNSPAPMLGQNQGQGQGPPLITDGISPGMLQA